MDTRSHYVDVMLRTPEIEHDLYARLLTTAHFRIKAGDALAIAWPDWKNNHGDFGFLFRIFGLNQELDEYVKEIRPLQDAELIRVFPILAVPDVKKRVAFCRDRSFDRFSPTSARRLTRRAEERGAVFTPKPVPQKKSHFLSMHSYSGNTQFNMFIRREVCDVDLSGGHQYGLGYAVPDF